MNITLLYDQLYDDPAALAAYKALKAVGGHVYIVGGAIRDLILGKRAKDLDLLVTELSGPAVEAALKRLPGKSILAGKQFGVYRYREGNDEVEIALPRTESSTGAGHTQFKVDAHPDIPVERDLERRDFTANAMAFDIDNGILIDPYGGQNDVEQRRLSLVNPGAFKDDPLRIVRALVAYAVNGLLPDPYTLDEMKRNTDRIRTLSSDRIRMELDKLLAGRDPAGAIEIANDTGLLTYMLPELAQTFGFDQSNPAHDLDVGAHSLAVLRKMTQLTEDPDLRLAALLHDIGKPDSFWRDESYPEGSGGHFYQATLDDGTVVGQQHEDVGADMARAFMNRLNYPTARINRVVSLIQAHMFPYFNSERGARRFMNVVGGDQDAANDLLTLREADASGKKDGTVSEYDRNALEKSRSLVQTVINKQNAFSLKDLAVNGNDLISIGISRGPQMGQILQTLMQLVIDHPDLNDKETLLNYVKENYASTNNAAAL